MLSGWNWWTAWSYLSLILFFFVMLGLGASLEIKEFLLKLKKPTGIILGAILQFLFMPSCCYLLTQIFQIDGILSVGIILIGCCPGGALSNIVCYLFMQDITLSIAMTTFSSLLALAFVPLNLYIYLELLYTQDDPFKQNIFPAIIPRNVPTIVGNNIIKYNKG